MRPLHCHKFSKVAGPSSLPIVGHLNKCCQCTVPISPILTVGSVRKMHGPKGSNGTVRISSAVFWNLFQHILLFSLLRLNLRANLTPKYDG